MRLLREGSWGTKLKHENHSTGKMRIPRENYFSGRGGVGTHRLGIACARRCRRLRTTVTTRRSILRIKALCQIGSIIDAGMTNPKE
jgi:hypothetical protein